MSEKNFFLTVICLTYLGLPVIACGPSKNHLSKCQLYSKGRDEKLSCSETNQLNHNAAKSAMVPTKIYYPSPNALISPGVPIYTQNANGLPRIHYPVQKTMSASTNIYPGPYQYHRNVRSMKTHRLNSKVSDDRMESLPHDLNLRDDLIRNRVRRNGDDAIVSSTTHQTIESDTTPNWHDLINFFQSVKSSDVSREPAEDDKSYQRSRETDGSGQSHEGISVSHESSGSSVEFIDRLRRRMPHLFQRLQSLRRLIADSSSAEDVFYPEISDPFDGTGMTDQLEKPERGESSAKISVSSATSTDELTNESMKHDNVEHFPTVTTLIAQDREITTTLNT